MMGNDYLNLAFSVALVVWKSASRDYMSIMGYVWERGHVSEEMYTIVLADMGVND